VAEIRLAGSLVSMRATRSLLASEASAQDLDLKLTGLFKMDSATLRRDDAQKGGSPQRVTYSTTPALQMSDSGPYRLPQNLCGRT